jgi:hypothetical protein
MDEREACFADGNLSVVRRVGNTVRREAHAWTPTVHALLRHLEATGFDGAPRVLGFDDHGRGMLSFIAGSTIPASLDGYRSDAVLLTVAQLLRRYHDASASFVAPPHASWQAMVGARSDGEVICHNDIAPYHTVMRAGMPAAFIDWDLAAPGPRQWDVAHALWRYAPLYAGEEHGTSAERARRMRLFCAAYGLPVCRDILPTIQQRTTVTYASVAAWEAAGVAAYVRLWQEGHAKGVLHDLAYLGQHWTELEQHFQAGVGQFDYGSGR